jgi:hypothetical protein
MWQVLALITGVAITVGLWMAVIWIVKKLKLL